MSKPTYIGVIKKLATLGIHVYGHGAWQDGARYFRLCHTPNDSEWQSILAIWPQADRKWYSWQYAPEKRNAVLILP